MSASEQGAAIPLPPEGGSPLTAFIHAPPVGDYSTFGAPLGLTSWWPEEENLRWIAEVRPGQKTNLDFYPAEGLLLHCYGRSRAPPGPRGRGDGDDELATGNAHRRNEDIAKTPLSRDRHGHVQDFGIAGPTL